MSSRAERGDLRRRLLRHYVPRNDMKANSMKIIKSNGLKGTIHIPGDKSISHRAIMLGALADGETVVENFLMGEDCLATIECFRKMGIKIEIQNPKSKVQIKSQIPMSNKIKIYGNGLHGLQAPKEPLYVGNSGTTIRILSGILAGQKFASEISGDASIQKRPMQRIVEPLRQMGAKIEGQGSSSKGQGEILAPLKFSPSKLKGIEYKLPIASAQVKSCLLLAGLFAKGKTTVVEPSPSRDHTERMLESMGVKVSRDQGIKGQGSSLTIAGGQKLKAAHIFVPGDISSAAFFMAAGLIVPNSEITIKNVGINPTRDGIIDVLHRMGANIEIENEQMLSGELRADIKVISLPAGKAGQKSKVKSLKAIRISGEIIPRLIDEIPIIALAATQAEGTTIIKDAKELRVKESDRIKAIATELRKLGANIEELDDGLKITGPTSLKAATCESGGDHRIAMMCAIAGLIAEGETVNNDTRCIDTSFPGFEEILNLL